MVLQQERPTLPRQDLTKAGRSLGSRLAWWLSGIALLALLIVVVFATRAGDSFQQEWLPEYAVDTAANAAVTATLGGPIEDTSRYVGGDANLDPDVLVLSHEWIAEYGTDTATDPAIAALLGGPVTTVDRWFGLDANLDPDMPGWWVPEYEIDTATDPEIAGAMGGPVIPLDRYVGSDANLDPDIP